MCRVPVRRRLSARLPTWCWRRAHPCSLPAPMPVLLLVQQDYRSKEKGEHVASRTYFQLPINADEGFPQSFRLSFNGIVYQVLLYVNVLEDAAAVPDGYLYTLPAPGVFMVMRVAREDASGPVVIFQRKLVPNLEYEAAEVAFPFQ